MKTAIVSGGAHGIGKAIALKLLKKGCAVVVLDSNPDYLQSLEAEKNGLLFFRCDVSHPDEVNEVMVKIEALYGKVDYLVNNAGISRFEPIESLSIDTWNHILAVNLSSVFYLSKACLPLFSENSAILNIASTRALMSEPDGEAYGASKGGIVALTHALAMSLGPKTRVNCISPGWIEVENYQSLSETDHNQHPAGRVGKVEDIAEAAYFLLSEKSGFTTGQNFVIDGGMTKKMIYD
ncbi:MAG: SDR family oxidoreductase [Bacteroidales bacterium]|nr:SDR family oxidoreductase [Bacteroidales bacterium]NLB02368.1 SDR family oxidoreductase [Bacteroidales bacterium]